MIDREVENRGGGLEDTEGRSRGADVPAGAVLHAGSGTVSGRVTGVSARVARTAAGASMLDVRVVVDRNVAGRAVVPFTSGAVDPPITSVVDAVAGRAWASQEELDRVLGALDGAPREVILGISMAAARAFAGREETELYRCLARLGGGAGMRPVLPVPSFRIVHGGRRVANRLDVRELMVTPLGAPTVRDALRAGAAVHRAFLHTLGRLGFGTEVEPDGGIVPALQAPEDVLDLLVDAIVEAGYEPGPKGVAVAMDLAAAELRHEEGGYRLNGTIFDAVELSDYLEHLVDRYPIWSLHEVAAPDDPKGWRILTERLGRRVQLVRDATTRDCARPSATRTLGRRVQLVRDATADGMPETIDDAIAHCRGTAATVSLARAGTVSAAVEVIRRCLRGGFGVVVSFRKDEAADAFAGDLSTGVGCGQLVGCPPVGRRGRAVYDRMLRIAALDRPPPYGRWAD